MIKHIIIWRLKAAAHGNTSAENAKQIKNNLEALQGRIPGLLKIEVGVDFSHSESSGDLVLYSEFTDREALEVYRGHPEHQAVFPFIATARADRLIADHEAN